MAETTTASVFMSGRSQAVRIPKAFWFDTERVEIRRRGQEVVLKPIAKEDQWAALRELVAEAREDPELVLEVPEDNDWEGYPRMGFDESREHFEMRVREYEQKCKRERASKYDQEGRHGQ